MTLHVQACGDPLLAAWPILYSRFTDLDLVRELPAGCAEVLFSSCSGDAVGGRHTRTDRHSFFLSVLAAFSRRVRTGRVRA
jgi:hypothetical protein